MKPDEFFHQGFLEVDFVEGLESCPVALVMRLVICTELFGSRLWCGARGC